MGERSQVIDFDGAPFRIKLRTFMLLKLQCNSTEIIAQSRHFRPAA
jgi:hypothetical protein